MVNKLLKYAFLTAFFCIYFCISAFKATNSTHHNVLYTITGYAQGTSYSIQYLSQSALVHKNEIDSIFKVLDDNFSLYSKASLISDFNQSLRGIRITPHLRHVITASKQIHMQTDGSFDVAILNLLSLWGKGKKGIDIKPSADEIRKALSFSGSQHISVHGDSLLKSNPSIRIDCDGIAQGYSVDVMASFLDTYQISNYLVEIGGEVKSKGFNVHGKPWRIGYTTASSLQTFSANYPTLHLSGWACTTSGRLSKYSGSDTNKLSHIINPKSGLPVDNGLVSVTVIAKDAMTADAYDNAFMVLGIEKTLALLKENTTLGVHFVYEPKPGQLKDTANSFFKLFIAD
ncbi:MAG: hypothetical protein RL642_477 [Bacteroidota bacterium]